MEGSVFSKVLKYSVLLLLLMLFSCSQESNVLMNVLEEYSLESVENGTFLESGSSINIVFSEMGNRAELIKIILEDSDGLEIASIDVEPDILKGLGMPMDLPQDLEDGVYSFHFIVMEGDIQIFEDKRYFFIADGVYDIHSLETYPPGIKVGDLISASVVLNFPNESDPWLRWTLAGEVIQEGFLSEMGSKCSFSAPEESGVYSLKVELFPVSPKEEQISSVFRHSDLFVSLEEGDDAPWKFIEDRTYLYFIEFYDAFINRMNPDDIPRQIGNPVPSVHGNYSGISFSKNDGLIFDEYALPIYEDGSSEDFLMAMAFSYTELPETGEYNIIHSGDESNSFSVRYLADQKVFLAELKTLTQDFHSSLPLESIDTPEVLFLELSYNSSTELASLSWMSNGALIIRDEGISLNTLIEGKTIVGSDGFTAGLPMIWYTLAVSSEETDLDKNSNNLFEIPTSDTEDENVLYERSEDDLGEINIENFVPGRGLASMVILSDSGTANNWTLTISNDEGKPLYSLNPTDYSGDSFVADSIEDDSIEVDSIEDDSIKVDSIEVDSIEVDKKPVKIVLSLINDDRGFFLSSSADGGMAGPFSFQETLNIKIAAGSDDSVLNIRNIRFFQD